MTVMRDVIPAFELFQPATIGDAVRLLDQHGADAWVLAGGLDSMDWLKDRIKRPKVVVDLSQVAELKGVRDVNGGLEIGAMTPLTEIVRHPVVKEKFGLLMQAAELVASPQIRNQGTIGGNVSQDTRCWYYRGGWDCYRAGGNVCYADTPMAVNREHAIFDADRCVAVSPSDTAPALVALDAQMVINSSAGERVVNAEDYFIGPGIDITRMTVLRPGDLLTAIRIPSTWAGAQFYFEKVRDRQVWDFPLVNVASAIKFSNNSIDSARVVVGAVSCVPKRLRTVEAALVGKPRDEATADMAGKMAVAGARVLRYNAYKVPLMRNLVKRAIRGSEGGSWTS
ncbi:MAG TPA: xanthine dehydrogenase family protein subunit M [Vicinamibacterales bacterium]|nr:xanthine dehydrogenase family protein subunit M [Vicinamibacterales bacterium]